MRKIVFLLILVGAFAVGRRYVVSPGPTKPVPACKPIARAQSQAKKSSKELGDWLTSAVGKLFKGFENSDHPQAKQLLTLLSQLKTIGEAYQFAENEKSQVPVRSVKRSRKSRTSESSVTQMEDLKDSSDIVSQLKNLTNPEYVKMLIELYRGESLPEGTAATEAAKSKKRDESAGSRKKMNSRLRGDDREPVSR